MMIYFRNAQLKMNINLKNLDKIKFWNLIIPEFYFYIANILSINIKIRNIYLDEFIYKTYYRSI